jgi:Tol biopolymer transport system component
MSSEGDAFSTTFSNDGKKLFYLKRAGPDDVAELWSTEMTSGRSDRVVPGYGIDATLPEYYASYAVTKNGDRLAFVKKDEKGISHLWIASTDHRSSPEQLTSVENEDEPMFLPDGNLVYRASEGGKNYIYTRQQDGSGRKRLLEQAVLDLTAVSPDGRWIVVLQKDDADKDFPYRELAYPHGGGTPVMICTNCFPSWSVDGKYLIVQTAPATNLRSQAFLLPVSGSGLPELPPEGLGDPEDLKRSSRGIVLPRGVDSVLSSDNYSYTITNIRRNIYRIPIS